MKHFLMILIFILLASFVISESKQEIMYKLNSNNFTVLTGQHICGSLNDINSLNKDTGKSLYIIGVDYYDLSRKRASEFTSKINNLVINYSKIGGIPMLHLHMINPETWEDANNNILSIWNDGTVRDTNINLKDLITENSNSNIIFKQELDEIARGLKDLENNNITVLFRPYHEVNGAWFWWGSKDKQDFINLWIYTYNYLTIDKNLNNLLWVYSPNWNWGINDVLDYYPGFDYVDIVSLDYYGDELLTDPNLIKDYNSLKTLDKPFGFSEFGAYEFPIPLFQQYDSLDVYDALILRYPETRFFLNYCSGFGLDYQTNVDQYLSKPGIKTLNPNFEYITPNPEFNGSNELPPINQDLETANSFRSICLQPKAL